MVQSRQGVWRRISVLMHGRAGAYRRLKDDGGTTLVETAISTALVMMLLFGVFDFSLAFYTYHYVSDAAREGSRWAMVRGSRSCAQTPNLSGCGAGVSDISAYVKGLSYPGMDSAKHMTVSVKTAAASNSTTSSGDSTTVWTTTSNDMTYNAPGDQVTVTVSYAFPLAVPFVTLQKLNVSSTSSMVIAQ